MTSLNDLITDILNKDHYPPPLQGAHPALAHIFQLPALRFDFNVFVHPKKVPGWSWQILETQAGNFCLYLPATWTRLMQPSEFGETGTGAVVFENDEPRQTFAISEQRPWKEQLGTILTQGEVLGFSFRPTSIANFYRWVLVIGDADMHPSFVWAEYTAGNWMAWVEGNCSDIPTLNKQITSLMNYNPWLPFTDLVSDLSPTWQCPACKHYTPSNWMRCLKCGSNLV